ncbi:DUF4176 domain-containing protein, partial [Clostridium botulinum]|nr:DUF4176 domain-containing protein [Clostridium botulinum]
MNKLLKVSLNLKIFILSLIVLVSMANVLNGC